MIVLPLSSLQLSQTQRRFLRGAARFDMSHFCKFVAQSHNGGEKVSRMLKHSQFDAGALLNGGFLPRLHLFKSVAQIAAAVLTALGVFVKALNRSA